MSCDVNSFWTRKVVRHFVLFSWLALCSQLPVSAVQNVVLTWNPSADSSVAGYKIYCGTVSHEYTNVVDVGNVTNATITGLPDDVTNFFSATTYDASTNESAYSDEVTFAVAATVIVTNPPPTDPPTNAPPVLNVVGNLIAVTNPADIHGVILSWAASADEGVVGYQIFCGTASGNYSMVTNVGLVTSLAITGLAEGSMNYFSVREFDSAWNESSMSSEAICFVPVPTNLTTVLSPITNLTVIANPTNANSVVLSWNASVDSGVAGYRIYCGTTSFDYTNMIDAGSATNLTVFGLIEGTSNYFAATEYDDSLTNESAFSSEVKFVVPVPVLPNQPPTLNLITNLTVYQNAVAQTVTLSGITSGSANENQTLKITAASSKTSLIPNPTISYISPKGSGTLTFKPMANAIGATTITVTVNDGGLSNNLTTQIFTVTVVTPPVKVSPAVLAAMPKFSRQLTNSATLAGKTISMGVAVSGRAPFRYQWKFNGTNLPSATASTLTLRNVKASQAGAYSVFVSNSVGSTNSIAASLIVYTNTAATLTSVVSANGQFGFAVSGVPGLKYVVQASSDMAKWVSVRTNTAPFTFTDTNAASFNQRFYRSYNLLP